MIQNNKPYQGINRSEYPDWLGWVIIDLLEDKPDAPKEHRNEIQIQLDYEVKVFNHKN